MYWIGTDYLVEAMVSKQLVTRSNRRFKKLTLLFYNEPRLVAVVGVVESPSTSGEDWQSRMNMLCLKRFVLGDIAAERGGEPEVF
jgi:hypothetical protein